MKFRLAQESLEWDAVIPPAKSDSSGVGVNHAELYVKALNATLEDGRKVVCKRKGLKISLTIGAATGHALLRKREHGPDVKVILRRALDEAAQQIGHRYLVEDGVIYLAPVT